MGDSGPDGHSPLRIFTRSKSVDAGQDEGQSAGSSAPRETANALLSSAFSAPYDEESVGGEGGRRSPATVVGGVRIGRGSKGKLVPRGGRQAYHPLPSYWREADNNNNNNNNSPTSSGLASPITPEGGIDEQARSLPGGMSGTSPLAIETSRSFQGPKSKTTGSPSASPRPALGAIREAFDSASSLAWTERPGSTYSYASVEQSAPHDYVESPIDAPVNIGRFPLSAMAGPNSRRARYQGSYAGNSESASPVREATGEDIVRKYFANQRRVMSGRETVEQAEQAAQIAEAETAADSGAMRRALSSGDLAGLEDMAEMHSYLAPGGHGKSMLTTDLVESPLEALVRQLTVELFQLYVIEDKKKKSRPVGSDKGEEANFIQQFRLGPSLRSGTSTPAVTMDGYFEPATQEPGVARPRPRHRLVQRTWMEEELIKARRVSTIDEHAEESILQALRSPDTIGARPSAAPAPPTAAPARKALSPGPAEDVALFANRPGNPSGGSRAPAAAAKQERARARPDLALGDLGAHPQEILQQLAQDRHPKSPRGYYRARDPAAPHRKATPDRAPTGISPAKASLLRAVGRRQSVRLQPGKGQIVVASAEAVDAGARARRSNSLPDLVHVPETREVSYRELQRKAARTVALTKTRHANVARRAERVVLGSARSIRDRKRGAKRPDVDMHLVAYNLPPPVPLRVRRDQFRATPEPLIVVRQPAPAPALRRGMGTRDAELLRVHNQLLGAQAVLSRHTSIAARRLATPATAAAAAATAGAAVSVGEQHGRGSADESAKVAGKSAVRSEALDVVMLDYAVDEHEEDAQALSEPPAEPPAEPQRWRTATRRSLRRKDGPSRTDPEVPAVPASASASTPASTARRLLVHGSAYRVYSGLKARGDSYLFLFSDVLVVTTKLGTDANTRVLLAPSTDASRVPDARFRVHMVIPVAGASLRFARDGGSKRLGEDDDAEERRLQRQEERIRRACHTFEKNTSEAVVYLINRNIIEPLPELIAGFLHRCTALSRRQLGQFLGAGVLGENLHENPTLDEIEQEKLFHRQIWSAFLDRCDVVGVPIDEALRAALFYVRLPNNPRAISVLLEVAALHWHAKNIDHAKSADHPATGLFVPESPDVAVKLAFSIMTVNTELHNPLLRDEIQPEVAFRDLAAKFRAALVDDPAVAAKRKGNVLRKRDQPRVVTIMEVPTDELRAIFDRVAANRLVTSSDARPAAPEFDIEWVRDANDPNALVLSDDQVAQEIEDVYCDPGFRDGLLFNASSDRLPARLNAEPPAWLRVTVRIPEPDPKFAISIRTVNPAGYEVVAILPSTRLSFRTSNAASFVIRPMMPGHVTLHFASEGSHARYYHPIPSRSLVVEGAFMRHTVQIGWRKEAERRAWYMFGMESRQTKALWARSLKAAVKQAAAVPSAATPTPATAPDSATTPDSAIASVRALAKDDQVVSGLELVTMMGGSL